MTATLAARTLVGPERVLVGRAAGGDHDAFDLLVGPRLEAAIRTATAVLRSESDARDAVQDAFVAAWTELPRLRDRDRFDAWFGRILMNQCRSAIRHRKVVRVREIAIEPEGEDGLRGVGIEGGQAAVPEADAIRRAFDRLDAEARILLVLHHVEERPVADIAAVAGIPEGTVKWRLHAARKALERALERERR